MVNGLTKEIYEKFKSFNDELSLKFNINDEHFCDNILKKYYDKTKKNNIQIPRCNYDIILRIIKNIYNCNCNILVFGLGNDSKIIENANYNGKTIFIESEKKWIDLNKSIKNKIHYKYDTKVSSSIKLINEKNSKYLEKFPIINELKNINFDIVLIDGPYGYTPKMQGRSIPIYWTHLLKPKFIFVDDINRELEKKYCEHFFKNEYDIIKLRRNMNLYVMK